MKLAEALALRADDARKVEQLRARIVANARFQEGEEPPRMPGRCWPRQVRRWTSCRG